ncbi:LysM peptidoglycan-binding domain-containing protein [Rhizobium sp. Rhizsp82]|uniref:LysM peptidoglycan-binding domain-containing protein n=1 Tax=Rhizobium sp. Rhizsp82 TaxID=3243057 RepID=UPI0039B48AA8
MMRNRAGLLALAVLAIAILLMVFVVMPRIGGDASKVGDAINQASNEVKNTVEEAGKTARNAVADAAATTEKVGRLTADAGQSLTELKALFADGKTPAADALATAKTKATGALQAIADFAAPDGIDPATAAIITKAKGGASKALATIQALPENAADALAALLKAESELTGAPAAQPGTAPQPQADTTAQAPAAADATAPAATAPAADQANAGPKLPAFDVLRVEPDGSTVIAGSAEPNGKLEVMDGDTVVTTTDVGPSGDFAAVLDNPLGPGDHQLVLKVTGKDGKVQTSEEVATVSVPKDGSGAELLAMVSKPGEASRIITAPKAEQQTAAATPAANGATPALPAASTDIANTAPAVPAAPAEVMVNAVEIEGNKIFVAGTAKANANVLAYADDKLIGKARAGGDGHFVIDGAMDLAVGDHKIRVDVVDGAGKVLVRAAVNFNRPEGDQVTVAAQTSAPTAAPAAATPSMLPLEEGELAKLKTDAGKAFALLKGLFVNGQLPGNEQLAAARSATEFALRSISEFRPSVDARAEFKETAAKSSQSAASALTTLQALPRDAKSVGAAIDKLASIIDGLTTVPAAPEAPAAPAAPAPATNEVASGNSSEPKTIEQAPLTTSNNTVIIRRGDTLWQISRRVYGAGVRYTTIYMANEDEIKNPDRILPGQIFGVPKDALPNSEELHRKLKAGEHL